MRQRRMTNEKTVIFFDLDGPILDVKTRYFAVYRLSSQACGLPVVNKTTFWRAKRRGLSNVELIAEKFGKQPAPVLRKFMDVWLKNIERPDFLRLDSLVPGAVEVLQTLRHSYVCILVTMRRNRATLQRQLIEKRVSPFFSRILSAEDQQGESDQKITLLKDAHVDLKDAWIIGDSEADILSGRSLGLRTCAVSNGIRHASYLRRLQPDCLLSDIARLPVLLEREKVYLEKR